MTLSRRLGCQQAVRFIKIEARNASFKRNISRPYI